MHKVIFVILIAIIVVTSYTSIVFHLNILEKEEFINFQAKVLGEKVEEIKLLGDIIKSKNQEIENKSLEINSLKNNISYLKSINNDLNSKVKNLSFEINILNSYLDKTETELATAKEEIEALKPVVKNYYSIGIRDDGTGVVIPMNVKINKGTGILSVNIKNVDLQSGVQASIRLAAQVASAYTGKSITDKDITVTFVNEGPEIVSADGNSAGAAVTATIIAALEDSDIRDTVMMTGTIEPDFSIGWVGGVENKAKAARDKGATKFLVPQGQGVSVSGIEVVEVSTINQVVDLVLG